MDRDEDRYAVQNGLGFSYERPKPYRQLAKYSHLYYLSVVVVKNRQRIVEIYFCRDRRELRVYQNHQK